MKNTKKIIKEQIGDQFDCERFRDGFPTLYMACQSGCFPVPVYPLEIDNKKMAVASEPTTDNKYIAFLDDYVANKGGTMLISNVKNDFKNANTHKWMCKSLNETLDALVGPDIATAIKQLKSYLGNDNVMDFYTGYNSPDLIASGWILTPLNKVQGYDRLAPIIDDQLKKRSNSVSVWIKGGVAQATVDQTAKTVKYYEDLGWKKGEPPAGGGYERIDLVKEKPNLNFGSPSYPMHKEYVFQSSNKLAKDLADANKSLYSGDGKSNCLTFMNHYEMAAIKSLDISQELIDIYKKSFNYCMREYKFPFNRKRFERLKNLNRTKTVTGNEVDYSTDLGKPKGGTPTTYRESVDNRIKNILRESLIEINQLKKKSLTEERELSGKRFSLILEQFSDKKRLNEDAFFEALFKEINSQKKQGISDKVIEEQLETIKNMPWFGGVLSGLKEMLVKWIINKFVPGGEETQIGQFITVALANLEFSEIPKLLTNCKSLTEWLTKSIIESMLLKFAESKGVSGGIADVIRNTIVDTIDSSQFYDTMEDKLSGVICSAFGGLKSKVQDIAQSGEETAQGNA